MKFDLNASAKDHILIVAHRGTAGGNIPCNTFTAYDAALRQGADMLETDITMGRDGTLFIFHPGMEERQLGTTARLPQLSDEEIAQLRYVNYDGAPTQFGIHKFDDLLEHFKDRCYINVDKFWENPAEIYRTIKRHNMIDQILVKSAPSPAVFDLLEELAPELPFLAITSGTHETHEDLLRRNINYIGAEVIFETDDDEVASPAFFERMRRDNKLVWVNSIIFDHRRQLSAGHSDDTAMGGDPEKGWGWLARRGFDFIQTDWTGPLVDYLKENKLYYR